MQDLLPGLRSALARKIATFPDSDLNRQRADILAQIRAKAAMTPGLFTLTVPTGGGKTLASLGFALDHAAAHDKRRIIYAIPYASITEQTAAAFRDLFGDIVLEHHSAIDAEKPGAEARDKLRLAMEDWAAPLVVTTNVQLFESLFSARPSRCRKLHNIANSVIVLDEAQCLPRGLLAPTLRMIEALAVHYGCTVVLCTATQPAFDSRQLKVGLNLVDRELAPNAEGLAAQMRRARIVDGGAMADTDLAEALQATPQGMVIVNSRPHALALYRAVQDQPGAVHLTTRQYPAHRRRILATIRQRLKDGHPCRLIATSLVEAGVDLDFPKGWRAEAGLDSVIQAAGRVNREGRHPLQDSTLTLFAAPDNPPPAEVKVLADAMRQTLAAFGTDALMTPEAIRDWFEKVYWRAGETLDREAILPKFSFAAGTTWDVNLAYRTVAEAYRMVESPLLPVIIPCEGSAEAIRLLGIEAISSGKLARALQPYIVQVPAHYREALRANGKGDFAAQAQRGDQFFVLSETELYRADIGLFWEGAEELSAAQMFM